MLPSRQQIQDSAVVEAQDYLLQEMGVIKRNAEISQPGCYVRKYMLIAYEETASERGMKCLTDLSIYAGDDILT